MNIFLANRLGSHTADGTNDAAFLSHSAVELVRLSGSGRECEKVDVEEKD